MHLLHWSEFMGVAGVILAGALLSWIACIRAHVHREWIRRPDRAEQLATLPSQWCIPVSTVLGCL